MGDHRAEVRCTFRIHGKTYENHWSWINWTDDGDGVDRRITEWFAECWRDARLRYDAAEAEEESNRRAAAIQAEERAELARLQAKYGA